MENKDKLIKLKLDELKKTKGYFESELIELMEPHTPIFTQDLFLVGIVNRSNMLIAGFSDLIEKNNFL